MKPSLICIGDILYDGKSGIREVLDIYQDGANVQRVKYKILASTQKNHSGISIIDSDTSCHLQSLATWAKSKLTMEQYQQKLVEFDANKIKLSPHQNRLVTSIIKEFNGNESMMVAGTHITIDDEELRPAKELVKKGLFKLHEYEVELTPLGVAVLKNKKEYLRNFE